MISAVSVSSLTTLGAVRDTRAPTKGDLGKETGSKKAETPSIADLLVTAIPTELVAPYTAVTAAIVGAVDKPTRKMPDPDQFEFWRWLVFAVLVLATAVVVRQMKQAKGSGREPIREILVAVVAARPRTLKG